MKYVRVFFVFGVGCLVYTAVELLWRGRTYAAMSVAGGLSLTVICFVRDLYAPTVPSAVRCMSDAFFVCVIEYLFGFVFNIVLGMKMWDYSGLPFNIYGQICPTYFILWLFLCALGDRLCLGIELLFARLTKNDRGDDFGEAA